MDLPRTKKSQPPVRTRAANAQKGKKRCSCCEEEKNLLDFYASSSPLFALDKRVPICKECVKKTCLNKNGEIDDIEFNKLLRMIDKPYYKDTLESSCQQFKKENSYIKEDDIPLYGDKILGLYFKNIMLRQDRNKSYADSEKDGFMHQNSNTVMSEKERILNKYADVQKDKRQAKQEQLEKEASQKWSKEDKKNKKYVISTCGYDPFDDIGLSENDRKYCFNIMSTYCDTDGINEDGHKLQSVIEMTLLFCQSKKITEEINKELNKENINESKIGKYTTSKSNLLSSINTIAKDNNISSNYNKNSKQGKDSLSSKMKEMEENGFDDISVNMFDIKTAEAFKQIDEISNNNIANQLTLDNNEYADIVKEQREMLQKANEKVEELEEENRNLKNKIIDLENGVKRK